MQISERLLKKWRQEALLEIEEFNKGKNIVDAAHKRIWLERILRMTQDLQDHYLIKRGKNDNHWY